MSLNAGHAPHCRMRGRPGILPPEEGLVIQSGSLLAVSAGRVCGRNAVKVHESATAKALRVGTTAGHRLSRVARVQRSYQNRQGLRAFPTRRDYKVLLFCR